MKLIHQNQTREFKNSKVGERYFWDGQMTMFVPCTPAWYPEQHKEVGEPSP